MALATLFWVCIVLGLYPFAGYPVCIALLAAIRPRPVSRKEVTPPVTVVISAYNEARHIEATVRNKLGQHYPPGLLDVMVVSDGSTDGTDSILARLAAHEPRLNYFRQEPRSGKTAALNRLIERARGEIVVFADANSMYDEDGIRHLVTAFADPEVGYVSGKMIYVDPTGSVVGDGCTAYMRYENKLRDLETKVGSVVGVDGGVDAIRRSLYRPMKADQLPDFVQPLTVVEQGYRVVFAPTAILKEETLTDESQEIRMRIRVTLRSFWALWDKRTLFNPFRYPLFSWQLASHKLLRYLSFAPLAAAAVINWALISRGLLYVVLAAGQVAFASCALLALYGPRVVRQRRLLRYCYYFALLNWTSAVAFWRFLCGQKQVLWQPRTG